MASHQCECSEPLPAQPPGDLSTDTLSSAGSWKDHVVEKLLTNRYIQWRASEVENSSSYWKRARSAIYIISHIAYYGREHLNQTYSDLNNLVHIFSRDSKFSEQVFEAISTRHCFRLIDILLLREVDSTQIERHIHADDSHIDEPLVVVRAWETAYIGDAANMLRNTLLKYQSGRYYHGRYTSLVQSSGTGKSRMIDELSKSTLVIPICLAKTAGSGYPPPDKPAFEALIDLPYDSKSSPQTKAFVRAKVFLRALFEVIQVRLEEIVNKSTWDVFFKDCASPESRMVKIASEFRSRMTDGMYFYQHNAYRATLYTDVIERTEELFDAFEHAPPSIQEEDLNNAVKTFKNALIDMIHYQPSDGPMDPPLMIVIAFDEAHTLLPGEYEDPTWSILSKLKSALRVIRDSSIFSVFISTSSEIHSPAPDRYTSVYLPLFETPFDVFVHDRKYSENEIWPLSYVASTEHITRLGRPLFYAQYAQGNRHYQRGIISFARQKLLLSVSSCARTPEQILACLAVRLGLDLQEESSLNWKLVQGHMCVFLSASEDFQYTRTKYSSEPLLAEAAYKVMEASLHPGAETWIMSHLGWPHELLGLMKHGYIDRRYRGQIAASLILLMARDDAVVKKPWPPPPGEDGIFSGRVIPLSRFLDKLTGEGMWDDRLPAVFIQQDRHRTMRQAFCDCNVYFNHFIKTSSYELVSQESLTLAMFRGAAIICNNNQAGIDIAIPYLVGDVLKKDAIGAILVRVVTEKTFSRSMCTALFDETDPIERGFYELNAVNPPPVIRMVFALASEENAITFRPPPEDDSRDIPDEKFTAYDMWCAGIEALKHLTKLHADSLRQILELREVMDPEELYKKSPHQLAAVRGMYPFSTTHPDHFRNWVDLDGSVAENVVVGES